MLEVVTTLGVAQAFLVDARVGNSPVEKSTWVHLERLDCVLIFDAWVVDELYKEGFAVKACANCLVRWWGLLVRFRPLQNAMSISAASIWYWDVESAGR